jgi:hypothetical protein
MILAAALAALGLAASTIMAAYLSGPPKRRTAEDAELDAITTRFAKSEGMDIPSLEREVEEVLTGRSLRVKVRKAARKYGVQHEAVALIEFDLNRQERVLSAIEEDMARYDATRRRSA